MIFVKAIEFKEKALTRILNSLSTLFRMARCIFLDLEITDSGIDVFRKQTHTGQYTHFKSFEPWARKTTWIKSLFHRAVQICSNSTLLSKQISTNR